MFINYCMHAHHLACILIEFSATCKGSPGSGGSDVAGPKGDQGERVSYPNFSLSQCLQLL